MPSHAIMWRYVFLNILLAGVYLATAKLGLQFAYAHEMATLIWMPTGISLAAVLLGGYGLLPGVALGTFLSVATADVPLWVAGTTAVGNTLEAFAGAFFLGRYARFDPALQRIRDVWALLMWAALFSTLFSATIGVVSLAFSKAITWAEFPKVWLIWWLGNAMSDVLIAPLVLVWSRVPRWQLVRALEFILMIALVSIATTVVFGGWIPSPREEAYPLAFAVFPFFIWAALRFEQYGSTAASFVSALFAVWWTVQGRGPFAGVGLHESIALLWVFMLATTLPPLLLAVSVCERRRAEEEIQRAYAQLREIINNAPVVAIQGYDTEGRVRFWNKASEQLYGFKEEEVLGKRLGEFLLSEEEAQLFEQMLQRIAETRQPEPLREWETRTADGTTRYVFSSLFPIRMDHGQIQIVCMDVDVTERKRLEAEILRAQRLESIARLAGGIAHDFNNLLTAIISYAEVALSRLPEEHPVQEDLQHLIETANRAADLVQNLLAFARRQVLAPQIVNLNQLVEGMVPILIPLLGRQIQLRIVPDPVLKTVRADPTRLEQVILNLAINARDAMPGGGTLTIRTDNVTLDEADVQSHPDVSPGEYVMLEVSDTGTGIEPEHLEHIFEPFYTTKGERGTGLGLAVVYGVVKQSGGHIAVQSQPGKGTSFHIYLPCASETSEQKSD
ncbi:MAG: MASE1 domain-containing protein [Armatimonadota bacterium]